MYTINIDNSDKLFFTSDTHLNHFNICKYCNRPFKTRSEMNETLINNWNSVVPEDGIVVHCGDFTLMHYSESREKKIGYDAYMEEIIRDYMKLFYRLNGTILFIRGNHDIIPIVTKPMEKLIASVDKALIMVDDKKIYADHFPATAFNGNYQVFGHIHTQRNGICTGSDADVPERLKPNQYDVGVDQNNYKPISYKELCDIFKKRENKMK